MGGDIDMKLCKRRKNRLRVKNGFKATVAVLLVSGLTISAITFEKEVVHVQAASSEAPRVKAELGSVIALENGDFENPTVTRSANWQTFDANTVPGWQTTASDNQIELQKNNLGGITAQSGTQWAELNAYEVSALYQDIPTTPGEKVRWQVYHRGRYGMDTAVVEFGAPGNVMIQQAEMVDGNEAWGLYTGSYTIPIGQTNTRFQFRSVSAAGGNEAIGNLLDNIQFATQSILDVTGTFSAPSTKMQKSVNYTVRAANMGGMPAANNTFSVKIPVELTYTPGTLSSANTVVTGENYDATTRTLTFQTGTIKKGVAIDVVIPLIGAEVTSAATPDTSVTYNDENFNDETYTADGMDDSVAVTSNEIPTITGEEETILQPNEDFDPMSTMTAQDEEDGDLTAQIQVASNNVDTSQSGIYEVIYEVTDSDGNQATFTRTVIVEEGPVITGDSPTRLNPNVSFDPVSTMQATDKEDGDLTSDIKVVDNPVDTSQPGTYEVLYSVTDSDGNQATFTRTVIVTEAPIITGEEETRLNPNVDFDPMSTMQATDKEDGNLTNEMKVTSNNVDTSQSGTYKVTYEVMDSDGNKAMFTRTVIVTEAPVITGKDTVTLTQGDLFDVMDDLQAADKEDGDLTAQIVVLSSNVNVNVPGTYTVIYRVTDSDGNSTMFIRKVIVKAIVNPVTPQSIVIQPDVSTSERASEKTVLPKTGDRSSLPTGVAGLAFLALSSLLFWHKK
ncbi:putative peptidoglycan linked protein [Listeria fleischmannii FSL S10-1203]|uniref:Putative peptidoglycan linked protein n=2 Tax=Listeria fleischmannii TaxID=1069827 RepID=W7D8K5_9LIST|nr:putative peptidoglycan linked protein [Listeria fleischmannii FSL S10-1203]